MSFPKDIEPTWTFVAGRAMKDPKANMLVVVDRLEHRCDIDEVLAWTYKERLVGLLFRGHSTHNLAVRFLLSSHTCRELARKLSELLDSNQPPA